MRRSLVVWLLAVLVLSACIAFPQSKPSRTSTPTPIGVQPHPIGPGGSWSPTFSDEFNGDTLNTTKWRPCQWWGCQGAMGNAQNCHLAQNNVIRGGYLDMQGRLASGTCQPDATTYAYTSGEIQSGTNGHLTNDALFQQTYGYFETRMWAAGGQGFDSGFWLFASSLGYGDGPNGQAELDVVEILGNDSSNARLTVHWANPNGSNAFDTTEYVGPDYAAGWHTFGVDWESNSVIWYVDGVPRKTYAGEHIPTIPMDVRANLDIGGKWAGEPDPTTPWPGHCKVDYIRVWRH